MRGNHSLLVTVPYRQIITQIARIALLESWDVFGADLY